MWANILNKFLNTRHHIKDKNGDWVAKQDNSNIIVYGSAPVIIPDTGLVIHSSEKPCVIEAIEWSLNVDSTIAPRLWQFDETNKSGFNNLFVFTNEFAVRSTITASSIGGYGSAYWDVRGYDETNYNYSFSLKNPIFMPAGAHLAFEGYSTYTGGDELIYHIIVREV